MISSEKEYLDAMRDMIRKVQRGYEPPFTADTEEQEVFADCIRNGYLLGRTTYIDKDGHEQELRTLDGEMHAELISHVVPPKGLVFLTLDSPLPKENERAKQSNEGHENKKRNKDKFKKIVSFIFAFVGFVGSVITIIQFWPQIVAFFVRFLP